MYLYIYIYIYIYIYYIHIYIYIRRRVFVRGLHEVSGVVLFTRVFDLTRGQLSSDLRLSVGGRSARHMSLKYPSNPYALKPASRLQNAGDCAL